MGTNELQDQAEQLIRRWCLRVKCPELPDADTLRELYMIIDKASAHQVPQPAEIGDLGGLQDRAEQTARQMLRERGWPASDSEIAAIRQVVDDAFTLGQQLARKDED